MENMLRGHESSLTLELYFNNPKTATRKFFDLTRDYVKKTWEIVKNPSFLIGGGYGTTVVLIVSNVAEQMKSMSTLPAVAYGLATSVALTLPYVVGLYVYGKKRSQRQIKLDEWV